jgi:hypothetical protein
MTRFPITIKGILDSDPVRRIGRNDFDREFREFLKQGVFSKNEELEFIRRTESITGGLDEGRDQVRVGDMLFERRVNRWSLDTLYMQYTSGKEKGVKYEKKAKKGSE